jgi:hypothetical protein
LYSVAFLISAIVFCLFARAETEPWARDNVHDEKRAGDGDADKELVEYKGTADHENPKAIV